MDVDEVGATWLDDILIQTHASGRTCIKIDPVLNPTDATPYYIEWLAMVSEGHAYLRSLSQSRKRTVAVAGEGVGRENSAGSAVQRLQTCNAGDVSHLPRCLLLTNDGKDHNVNVDVCHDIFHGLYPQNERNAHRIKGASHEIMLAEQQHATIALNLIYAFVNDN